MAVVVVVVVVAVLLKEFTDEGDTNNSTAAIREKLEDDLFIVPVNMPSWFVVVWFVGLC